MTGDPASTFVVIVAEGDGAARAARLAGELRNRGGRVAVFASEGSADAADDADAVAELMAELGATARPSGRDPIEP